LCEQLAELGWRKKRDGVIEQKEDSLVAAPADRPANSLQIEFAAPLIVASGQWFSFQ
jgi:hypothetical protein